ncbi:MAG: multiheme c-type cytochrome [Candidatus Sulfotelmatobacter sp.]
MPFPILRVASRVAAVAFLLVAVAAVTQSIHPAPAKNPPGNDACARCHAEINSSYQKTVMANASGTAADGLITGQFDDKDSGVRYRVYQQDGRVWMSYERGGRDAIRGQRELLYFIGSGKKGRTYLFSDDQFLFETPINWYSQERRWNMTPAYTEAQEIPMNLPAYPSCLNCHTSGMQPPEPGSDCKFTGKPFLHAGITCERCHGAGEEHENGKGMIVNPAKLPAERRDAICMECHFEGTVAVEEPGKRLYDFQPGERLSDYMHYFVMTETQKQKPQALSQFQALSQSQCKRQSGEKMWCGSCHDSHSEPAPAEKAAYYRGKCLACHGDVFAARHHADKPDCRPCHMPALPSKDVAHTEATDHRILRFPNAAPLPQLQVRGKPLVSFPAGDDSLATTRDFALAWETLAERGFVGAPQRAENYLRQAVKEAPDDAVLLAALGFVEQEHGHASEARDLYERALKIDPSSNDAATNLGILQARAGNLRSAVELWNPAFARVPNRSAIGMDLAITFCVAGKKDIARKYVERVLEFNPDYPKGKSLLENLGKEPAQCRP